MAKTSTDNFQLPPQLKNSQGDMRCVGFEIEFSGIDLTKTVATLQSVFNAEIVSESDAEVALNVDELGKFNVEIDWAYLKDKAADHADDKQGREWMTLLSQAAAVLVPIEVVCPPIPLDRLGSLTDMVSALKRAGAIGTNESLIAAYGVHVNTEIPAFDATTLGAYIQSFCLLQWWLVDTHGVDIARRVSPYIDLYPEAYIKQVLLHPDASVEQIFDDYLQYNPTRNRALDLLPLLAHIDEERVRAVVDDPRIKSRPAFHYRLPDCRIEQDNWSLETAWQTWLVVERLASRPDDLKKLGGDFLRADRPILDVSRSQWVEYIDQWLTDHSLV